jgi:hypothetical protein
MTMRSLFSLFLLLISLLNTLVSFTKDVQFINLTNSRLRLILTSSCINEKSVEQRIEERHIIWETTKPQTFSFTPLTHCPLTQYYIIIHGNICLDTFCHKNTCKPMHCSTVKLRVNASEHIAFQSEVLNNLPPLYIISIYHGKVYLYRIATVKGSPWVFRSQWMQPQIVASSPDLRSYLAPVLPEEFNVQEMEQNGKA